MKSMLRRAVLRWSRTSTFAALVGGLERFGQRRDDLLWVLTYHRVDEPGARPELDPDLLSATPSRFSEQMDYLARSCQVIGLSDLLRAVRGNRKLPPRAVLLTFDDAYRDFAEHAWPMLRQRGLPVTLFVATAYPDQPWRRFWWDRLHQAVQAAAARGAVESPLGWLPTKTEVQRRQTRRRLKEYLKDLPHNEAMKAVDRLCDGAPRSAESTEGGRPSRGPAGGSVLSWDELRRLHAEGVTLAPHTRTHPLLHRVPLEVARREAEDSLADLRREIGSDVPAVLAYPSGGHSDEMVRVLRQAGFAAALTTCRGVNRLRSTDALLLRRINVGCATSLPLLRAQLLPWAG